VCNLQPGGDSQETLHHLRWMMQKDEIGQDIFLIGHVLFATSIASILCTCGAIVSLGLNEDAWHSDFARCAFTHACS
jgi:hypothetical protein